MLAVSAATHLQTVKSGIIHDGLTNPWIPDGWRWGGAVSNCAPLWCEVIANSPYKTTAFTQSYGNAHGHGDF